MKRRLGGALSIAGFAVLLVAVLCPPFDRLADKSFAWHMVQHIVLLYVAPLLLLVARPFGFFLAVLGKRRTASFIRATRVFHIAGSPAFALFLYIATLWLTHLSGFYELSLERSWVHALEHALYLVAGTLFWMPVVAPQPLRPLNFPLRLLYLFAALPQGAFVAAVITSAPAPLYAHYAAVMPFAKAVADQRNAAAIMWVSGGFIIFCAIIATLGTWAAREGRADGVTVKRRMPQPREPLYP